MELNAKMTPEQQAKLDGLVTAQIKITTDFQAEFEALLGRFIPPLVEHYLDFDNSKPDVAEASANTQATGLIMYRATEALVGYKMGDEQGYIASHMFDRLGALTKGFSQVRSDYTKQLLGATLRAAGEEILKETGATETAEATEAPCTP